MTYALFLGCTIPARSRNYELSARKVAQQLGIELVDMNDFVCCGFPLKSADMDAAERMAAYNLSLAQKQDLDICALCSSCLHKDLSDLTIAIHYGCHYLKPSAVHNHFDDVEDPRSLDTLIGLTGAKVIDYPGRRNCCGGPLLPVEEALAASVSKEKLDAVKEAGADAICLVCPFCAVMYDGNQKSIESQYGVEYGLPVLYLTQLLGVAMGFDRKELGLNMNVVKTKIGRASCRERVYCEV